MNIFLPLSSFSRCSHNRAQSADIIFPVCLSVHSTLQNYFSNLLKFYFGLYVKSLHIKYLMVGYISVHCYGQFICNSVKSWICRKPLSKTVLYRPRKLRWHYVHTFLLTTTLTLILRASRCASSRCAARWVKYCIFSAVVTVMMENCSKLFLWLSKLSVNWP